MTLRSLRPLPLRSALLATALLPAAACNCDDTPNVEPVEEPEPTPAPQYNRGFYLDMALDSQGRPWLAYQDRDTTALAIARGAGDPAEFTHWQVDGQGEVVSGLLTGDFDGGYYASIAVDGSDVAHAAHWDKEEGRLRYATGSGEGTWTVETADSGDVGQFSSTAIWQGQPLISYYDYGQKRLKVAWKQEGSWQTEVVDEGEITQDGTDAGATDADVGKYSKAFVAGDGTVHIAYFDDANGDLKVASGYPGNWSVATWFGTGVRAGAWPELSEHANTLWVAFQDLDKNDLLFGSWNGTGVEPVLVDGGDFVGADAAIAWVSDLPVLMYHDGVNNDAKLARQDSDGNWTISTHMADGAVGFHNNLAVDASGRVNWACFDHTRTDIVFQRFSL